MPGMPDDELTDVGPMVPQYPGDDTRPTSKRELAGWFCYGWAAEVFAVCAMGMRFNHHILQLFGNTERCD